MNARLALALAVALPLAAGCEKKYEFDPPDRARRVAAAESIFSPALFDTIAWASDEERIFLGNEVYATHCRRCHGPLGEGDTPYARERGLEVPSLVAPDWEYAGDVDAVRRRIFTGHPAGMPVWGMGPVSAREIDAVAHYILEQLRPEMTGARGSNPARQP